MQAKKSAARRSEFYHQLGKLLAGGVAITRALDQLGRHPPSRAWGAPAQMMLKSVEQGYTLTEAARLAPGWFPEFDLAILHAGEQSGQMEFCLGMLAKHYAERARLRRQVLTDLAYPVILLHAAIFIFPFPGLFLTGDVLAYARQTFGVLLPIYAVVLGGLFAMQTEHGEVWRRAFEMLLAPVPLLGRARRELALGRLAGALGALLTAGVNIFEAWELAASASGSPELKSAVVRWRPLVEGGQTPAEVVVNSGKFPETFAGQYATGEVSGKLDETLRWLHTFYTEEGTRRLQMFAQWTPRLVYVMVALMVAYRVVQFWMGYFGQIRQVLQ